MKNFLTAMMVAGLGLTTLSARAQESTGPITPVKPGPVTPAEQPVVQGLSLEQLGSLLQQLGYNPRASRDQAGKVIGYNLEFSSKGWTMRLYVSLSKSGTVIWLDSGVGRIVDPAGVSRGSLLKLLGEHDRLWPSYVCYYPATGKVLLVMPIQNRGVTAATLKKEIDSFASKLQQMITLFKASQATPVPQPAPVP